MKRLIEKDLLNWKNKSDRKPLIIYGARQVGKTHSMIAFGRENYKSTAYFFFENDIKLQEIFNQGITDIYILFGKLEQFSATKITPGETLIIFDEIQACPAAITALKRIQETANEYHIVCGGSLLGLALFRDAKYSYPVGKVDLLNMFPMSFQEFLMAVSDKTDLIHQIEHCYENNLPMIEHWHDYLMQQYRKYLVIGGMPECVLEYLKNQNFTMLRAKQLAITEIYTNDMVKYCTKTEALKNIATYNSIPSQLGRENRKFQFNLIKSGARSKDFSDALFWLEKANIILRVSKSNQGYLPLNIYEDLLSFKIYMSDVGLLCAKIGFPAEAIITDFAGSEIKGLFAENYVAQELVANGIRPFYWESSGKAEVDFVIQETDKIIPIEVKSGIHSRSKSLDVFIKKYNIVKSLRISAKNFGFENGIKSVPLYAAWCIKK